MPDEPPQETATEDSGPTYWSVDDARWPAVRPSLPAEMVDLLAPPIVVGVARVTATSRMTPPVGATAHTTAPGAIPASGSAGRSVGTTSLRFAPGSHPAGPVAGRRPGTAHGRHRS
ncbi:hypothetical protein [Micromonospora rhizosphaerae]|nr:hypothetical protein [Micromonospora rhizosphaerae]